MELSVTDRQALERLEESLWREETRFDRAYMERILAVDFFEFGRSGRLHDRAATLAVARGPIHATLPLPGFEARLLSPDLAQVTYRSAVVYGGATFHARRCSLWSRSAEGWTLRFHQGTPLEDAG